MPKIDQTIETILADAKPVSPVARPEITFFIWCGITLVATLILMAFSGFRPDLSQQVHTPLFVFEVVSLLLLIASTALVAIWLSFPDLHQKPWVVFLPLIPVGLYVGCILYGVMNPEMETVLPEDAGNGINCVLCITMYSLIPGFWMFRTLRRHATTRPMLAGALSLLASASIGLLALKFLEGNDSILHLVEWHLIPIVLFGVLGAFIGKKFLRW